MINSTNTETKMKGYFQTKLQSFSYTGNKAMVIPLTSLLLYAQSPRIGCNDVVRLWGSGGDGGNNGDDRRGNGAAAQVMVLVVVRILVLIVLVG